MKPYSSLRQCVPAMATLLLLQATGGARAEPKCAPAVEATLGVSDGLTPLPGAGSLPAAAFTEAQGSLCGLSAGASFSTASEVFDARLFSSYTYTLGYADFSEGFVHSETKVNSTSAVIRRDFFFTAANLHPTRQSEIGAEVAGDPIAGAWKVRANGIDRLWASRNLGIYGFLSFDHLSENQKDRMLGGNLLAGGLRFRRKLNNRFSVYAEIGVSGAWRAAYQSPESRGIFLLGVTYRRGYHDAADLAHMGIREH